jgi:hypothetical protein
MIRRCYGLMTFYVVVLTQTSTIDLVFLSVKDFGPRGCRGIDETPWTLDRVGEWTIGV